MNNRHTWLMIGSNATNKAAIIDNAATAIAEVVDIIAAGIITDTPDITGRGDSYLNKVILCQSSLSIDDIKAAMKEIEWNLGRRIDNSATVVADIDIVVDAGKIIKAKEFDSEAFRQGVASIISSDEIHPLAVREMQHLLR
jgi:7,8-dihydro-6-hydroxymethylpterin-pyrophosphokinase